MTVQTQPGIVAGFGQFELNLRTGELRKGGSIVRLQPRPTKLLTLLVRRAGEMVTRDEVRQELWGDTFVEFDHALNTCMQQVRSVLNDSADSPRYVETIPRRGYRFICPVVVRGENGRTLPVGVVGQETVEPSLPARLRGKTAWLAGAVLLVVAGSATVGWRMFSAQPAGPAETRLRLAVMPFEELGPASGGQDLATGLTEDLIGHLGRLGPHELAVVAGAPVDRGSPEDLHKRLGVQYVLEGSVRRSGGQARITARLVRVADRSTMWTATFDPALDDILAMQRDIAHRVASALALKLLPSNIEAVARVATHNPRAYEAYLLARGADDHTTMEGLERSLALYQEAIREDPDFALAHAGLADTYIVMAERRLMASREAFPKARQAVQRALELNPSFAEASASRAAIRAFYDWDWVGGEADFLRTVRENPNHALAYRWYAQYLYSLGRLEEALVQARKAQALEPHSPLVNWNVSMHYYYARQPAKAIEMAEEIIRQAPASRLPHATIGLAALLTADYHRAIAALETGLKLSQQNPAFLGALGHAYGLAGRPADARRILRQLHEVSGKQFVSSLEFAYVHLGLGEVEQTFAWLEKAFSERAIGLRYLRIDPRFDPLRNDPRFDDLLRRMNFPRINIGQLPAAAPLAAAGLRR